MFNIHVTYHVVNCQFVTAVNIGLSNFKAIVAHHKMSTQGPQKPEDAAEYLQWRI